MHVEGISDLALLKPVSEIEDEEVSEILFLGVGVPVACYRDRPRGGVWLGCWCSFDRYLYFYTKMMKNYINNSI